MVEMKISFYEKKENSDRNKQTKSKRILQWIKMSIWLAKLKKPLGYLLEREGLFDTHVIHFFFTEYNVRLSRVKSIGVRMKA
ncbi:hypothetical protein AXX17_AT4G15490 [Arabidopsis thaliana]|uniref:Uncharacterized protein n=1 Tax=Arabidopsis thaliana TaxID=3702 RepID=A0A178V410_ARATH|nr:hypothetical protein AXX17_AT4G15490 [Arabidopsis thaliana]